MLIDVYRSMHTGIEKSYNIITRNLKSIVSVSSMEVWKKLAMIL
jgi:hypothetical protein